MDRQSYLNSLWSPYPPAQPGWLDVHEFLKSKRDLSIVCGRIQNLAGPLWRLTSAGHELLVRIDESTGWLSQDKVKNVDQILKNDDVVALQLENSGDEWRARACELLVPVQGSSRPLSMAFERSRDWMDFLEEVRRFFREREFIEVLTPTLVPSPGTEPFLDPFETEIFFSEHRRETRYLPTSPEFHLKQVLSAGWTKIFEIKTCFRNAESGAHHQLEFQMLEWYRAYATLDSIADDVEDLCKSLVKKFRPRSTGAELFERVTVSELFKRFFDGFELSPETSRDDLVALALRSGVRTETGDTWDEVFFRLFLERIEPKLGLSGPILVSSYPASQAALARIGKNGFAERFEVYWRGLEIANAFHELNDPDENEIRFKKDAETKRIIGKPEVPVDENLLRSLRYGLPPSGGIALGLERLFMALFEIESIEETRLFPYRHFTSDD